MPKKKKKAPKNKKVAKKKLPKLSKAEKLVQGRILNLEERMETLERAVSDIDRSTPSSDEKENKLPGGRTKPGDIVNSAEEE